jgi:hypothetical protein
LIRDKQVSLDPQTYDSSLSLVDPEFATNPVVIWRGTAAISCAAWQPLPN